MFKLYILFSAAAAGLAHAASEGPTVGIPISEEAVVKSDRVGNNFAYSIRHEQRSVIPVAASALPQAAPLSAHPVNVVPSISYPPVVAGVGVGSAGSSASSSASSTSASSSAERSSSASVQHQFKSTASQPVAGANSQQAEQTQQQQLIKQQHQQTQDLQQKQHQQVQDYQQQQQHQQQVQDYHQQQQQHQQQVQDYHQQQQQHQQQVQDYQQQVQDYQQQQQAADYRQEQQHKQAADYLRQQQHQQASDYRQHQQMQQDQHHLDRNHQQSVSSNSISQGQHIPGPIISPAGTVLYASSYAHHQPLALRTPVVSQPAQIEVVHQSPAGVYTHNPPAAVGIFNYPSPPGAALVQGTSSEIVRDTAKVVHQPPTFYFTQIAPGPTAAVYGYPEPAPEFYAHPTAALVSAQAVAHPEDLKFADGSTLKLADTSSVKWADASKLKWADGPILKWSDASANPGSMWADANSAQQRFDSSSPIRFAEAAAVKFADSVKYATDGSASKFAASDSSSSKYTSGGAASGSIVDSKIASSDTSSSPANTELASKAAVQHIVKSESENRESASAESRQSSSGPKIYSAPAFYAAAAPQQQAYYAESVGAVPARRFYTTTGLVHEPTFYAARIAHPTGAAVFAPGPLQQTLVPAGIELHALHDKAAQAHFRGFQLPSGGQFHYVTTKQQPTAWVSGVHQSSGAATSHESHSQSSSQKKY